jgi:endonuclease/exonuclease/phosphatase family metal-dependent hydrolase
MRGRLAALVLCLSAHATAEPSQRPRQGRFNVVTYNVAGLPEGLSQVHPVQNLPLIGAALNRYDLVFVQEDYAYPELLRSRLQLSYKSPAFVRGQELHFGDGLSNFSKFPFGDLRRAAWRQCHGVIDSYFDCLTPKGLAMTRVELSPGVFVDSYNVHLDAGGGAEDVVARAAQLKQLFETLASWSDGAAVLVAGDFNLTKGELSDLRTLAAGAGLSEACDTLRCGQTWRLDRVLFRGGASLDLRARSWRVDTSLRDGKGQPLSDHLAVVVGFDWATRAVKPAIASAGSSRRPGSR